MGYERAEQDGVMGIPGAAIGFCQALFGRAGRAREHTERVVQLLEEINAPWARSHEMFWGYRGDQDAASFVQSGAEPLCTTGRVPILITGLDAGRDKETIRSIVRSAPPVAAGETILVRVVLRDEQSTSGAVDLIRSMHDSAITHNEMPGWWPLLQGDLSPDGWDRLRVSMGSLWQYVNVAVNSFTSEAVIDHVADQVTVAQIPVGAADGIHAGDGLIALPQGMTIAGAPEVARYSLFQYVRKLQTLPVVPTLVVLGPSMPGWSDAFNQQRLSILLPLLERGCRQLWGDLPKSRQDHIWRLSA